MKIHRTPRALLGALLIVSSGYIAADAAPDEDAVRSPATAISPTATFDQATVSNFAGKWDLTVIGQTGCGFGTAFYNITLPASGTGTATGTLHNGCGDSSTGTVSFHIDSVTAHGSGTGGLTCGAGCGWALKVQISPNHDVFTVVDVDPTNPSNFIAGTAIRQSY
jgi:hypothetical protein